ncbi:MAG: DUF5615 family PIN-like protein [Acidimicrobiales bacterium]
MRFLLDEMCPPVAAERLRDRDIDALAVTESTALAGLEDEAILALAGLDQRVLVTSRPSGGWSGQARGRSGQVGDSWLVYLVEGGDVVVLQARYHYGR